jgi:hypothetical protein
VFEKFPKLTRFSHDWTITEKIDGTNAQIIIVPEANPDALPIMQDDGKYILGVYDHHFIFAGSRTRLLTEKEDNYGFAKFVAAHGPELVDKLGEGRHFGEWCGLGIQRNYGLNEKVFALFNTTRWTGVDLPMQVRVVPVLLEGYIDNPGSAAKAALNELAVNGSRFAPGFLNAEGVVMRHGPSGTLFKKTFDYDEAGKWAENQAAKAQVSD